MKDDPAAGQILDGLESPRPPDDLRSRVLAATRQTAAGADRLDPWTRLFRNRPLRIAWACSVSLLVAANAFLPTGRVTANEARTALALRDREVEQIARLPSIDTRLLPSDALTRAPLRARSHPALSIKKGIVS